MSYTPGPWSVTSRDDKADGFVLRDPDGEYISYLDESRYHDGRRDPEAEANARLIAAAPDLLAALRDLVTRCDGAEGVRADGSNIQTMAAHAAIARAEGK